MKNHFSEKVKNEINSILGLSAMGMGISSIVLMNNMPAVVMAVIFGTYLGLTMKIGSTVHTLADSFVKDNTDNANRELFVTAIVLFCASGTGIYGALTAGMNGDMSILITKSILDFVTAMLFACNLGKSVCIIAIPQFLILALIYLLAGLIVPLTTPAMIADFKACGGLIMLATGFRMLKLQMFPIADMIPSMILVMPFSYLWVTFILQWI